MPNKKKKIFSKHNSTKFVLITDGRDEHGNKITENYLMPVSSNHTPGSSLLLSKIAGVCNQTSKHDIEVVDVEVESEVKNKKRKSKPKADREPDLEKILGQMSDESEDDEDEDDSDDEEYNELVSNLKNTEFFDKPESFKFSRSNVYTEILENESDFSDDFGQFSDAEYEKEQKPGCNLTSAKADCPESLQVLNDGFEKILEEYEENQIGALDDVEICGAFSPENEQLQNFIAIPQQKPEENIIIGEIDESIKKKILLYTEVEKPEKIIKIITEKPIEWDCESILSTYSNKYNHPTIIKEESKIKKIKIPANPLKKRLTKSQLKQLESASESEEENDDKVSVITSCNVRIKGETPEQKRERKTLFKEAKRESRILKKENKLAFKNEKKIQEAVAMNAQNNRGRKLY